MDDNVNDLENLVHMTRLALRGNRADIEAFARRCVRSLKDRAPTISDSIRGLLSSPANSVGLREAGPLPVDNESRLRLLRYEYPVTIDGNPILSDAVQGAIEQIVAEHQRTDDLLLEGLIPTRTAVFVGPPGVGKTLSARWIAARLRKPMLTLDLTTVMSSFLGRTGANIRSVLDYAKSTDGVLLLDELDAIAKRRDDETEIGELKRLVTVLLQEIDLWPAGRLLIAASNHGDLLDKAIWRRFDIKVEFGKPDESLVARLIRAELADRTPSDEFVAALSLAWRDQSQSDVVRELEQARRRSVLSNAQLETVLRDRMAESTRMLPLRDRKAIAQSLLGSGVSQRLASEITGLARDTIRKATVRSSGER